MAFNHVVRQGAIFATVHLNQLLTIVTFNNKCAQAIPFLHSKYCGCAVETVKCIKSNVLQLLSADEHPACLEIKLEYWKLYTKAIMELLCFTGVRKL